MTFLSKSNSFISVHPYPKLRYLELFYEVVGVVVGVQELGQLALVLILHLVLEVRLRGDVHLKPAETVLLTPTRQFK